MFKRGNQNGFFCEIKDIPGQEGAGVGLGVGGDVGAGVILVR